MLRTLPIKHRANKVYRQWVEIFDCWNSTEADEDRKIKSTSAIKAFIRFIENIDDRDRPIWKRKRTVYSDQDTLCSFKYIFVFRKKEIADILHIKITQLHGHIKKYPKLKKIIKNPNRELFYVSRSQLENFYAIFNYKLLLKKGDFEEIKKINKDKMELLCREEEKYDEAYEAGQLKCPICNTPICV